MNTSVLVAAHPQTRPILIPEAPALVAELQDRFALARKALVKAYAECQAGSAPGGGLDSDLATREIREGAWRVHSASPPFVDQVVYGQDGLPPESPTLPGNQRREG